MFNGSPHVGCCLTDYEKEALGIVVAMRPKASAAQLAAREEYWYNQILDQMANDLADQYRQAGYKIT